MPELQAAWESLENSPSQSGFDSRVVHSDSPLEFCAALRANGTRMFVIACNLQSVERIKLPESSDGLEIRRLLDNEYDPKKFAVSMALRNNKYRDLFDAVIDDVCNRTRRSTSEFDAFKMVVARITEWQKFFAKLADDGLSEERRRGLYGELSFLRRLVDGGLIHHTGLAVWTGPSNADQDFQFRRGAVEVKVSLSAQNQELVISSERQLDTRAFDVFYIYHLALAVKKQTGETLNELVDSIRASISVEQQLELNDLLFEYGYSDAQRELYQEDGYVIRDSNYFEVIEGFPRITEELTRSIPGVGKVKYSIDVPVCLRFKVPEEKALNSLRRLYE